MLFTNLRTYSSYTNKNSNNNVQMVFSKPPPPKKQTSLPLNNYLQQTPLPLNRSLQPKPIPEVSKISTTKLKDMINPPNNENKTIKKMKWGEPTWFLFHTIAEKVKSEYFSQIRKELFEIIIIICRNLPCPDCAEHATTYTNNINFNNIQTKEQLKDMLWTFHNSVNQRKMFPQFPREELDSKYSNANTIAILKNFMVHFQDKHASIRMIANDFFRNNIAEQLKKWFNNNIQYFDL